MELRDYLHILRKRWIVIAALTVAGIVIALAYSLLKTPEYSSSAKVFVSTSGGSTVSDLQQGNTFTQQRVKTYADLVTTPIVLLPVISDLGLDESAEQLAARVTASAPLDTTLIEIEVTDEDPAAAAELATAISQSLTSAVEAIETTGEDGTSPVKLTLVQHAAVPQSPVSPNIPLNLALGALIGLALGVGVAVLRETLDTRIHNEHDVEQVTDRPILGGIAYDAKAADRPLVVRADPTGARAESFRTLRTNLQYLDLGRPDRAFVVTSAIEGEGKSTTAANLAIALADAGLRVLLVDADLRRPRVERYMGIEGAVGLTDILVGRTDARDVIQRWGRSQLFVLPSGRIPPNPSELLGSGAMVGLIDGVAKAFDVVLYDAPPLLPVTDAAVLARNVKGVLLVVAAGKTHRNQLTGALAALDAVGAPVSGIVMSMVPAKGPNAYGYGRYGYGSEYVHEPRTPAHATAEKRRPASAPSASGDQQKSPQPTRTASAEAAAADDPFSADMTSPTAGN